jgi:hypothetical protein
MYSLKWVSRNWTEFYYFYHRNNYIIIDSQVFLEQNNLVIPKQSFYKNF